MDLIAELDLAFRGDEPQEAGRPIAARQLRNCRAMRAVGDFLKSAGQEQFQYRFYELAEALHDLSEGRRHPVFEIDDSVRPGRGRPADLHDVWRLRANLCAGICWLMASGQTRDEAIRWSARGYGCALARLARAGTKTLEKAIGGWLERFENPTQADDAAAVAVFKNEIAELERLRPALSAAELRDFGSKRIEEVARRAAEFLKKSN